LVKIAEIAITMQRLTAASRLVVGNHVYTATTGFGVARAARSPDIADNDKQLR
jgi:hypothetical protein